jgi:3-hydroxybutyryl-CoA dehydrogenase
MSKVVCVVGGGIMGSGIAQVLAGAGMQVRLCDVSDALLARARQGIERSLARFIKAGKLTEADAQAIAGRIEMTTDLETGAAAADFVIEAVTEDLAIKAEIFRRLDAVCRPEVIFASNTSQISITSIAATTRRPAQVLGLHFFNPPPVMRLVEVIRGLETSDETLQTALALVSQLGKTPVVCKDAQGFITSRIIMATILEGMRILEAGLATKEDIDQACRLGFNWPMGPIELVDFTGLDTFQLATEAMREVYGEQWRSPQILRQHVAAHRYGRKNGHGFYAYPEAGAGKQI